MKNDPLIIKIEEKKHRKSNNELQFSVITLYSKKSNHGNISKISSEDIYNH